MLYFFLGLYHGSDIRFGNSISHSHSKSKRSWHPNVFSKRVWSFALDDWVRFKMTARAMKAIDDYGGIDNYLLRLDEETVQDSRYIAMMRDKIAAVKFHQGNLHEKIIKRLGYHRSPPPLVFSRHDSTKEEFLPEQANQSEKEAQRI